MFKEPKVCLLCGLEGVRQPVIKTKIVAGLYVPQKDGGKSVARNMFSCCKFHKRLYEDWATTEERAIIRKTVRKHLQNIYPDWNFTMCYKEEK